MASSNTQVSQLAKNIMLTDLSNLGKNPPSPARSHETKGRNQHEETRHLRLMAALIFRAH